MGQEPRMRTTIQRWAGSSPCLEELTVQKESQMGKEGGYSKCSSNDLLLKSCGRPLPCAHHHILPADAPAGGGKPGCLQLPVTTGSALETTFVPFWTCMSGPVWEFLWNVYSEVEVRGHRIDVYSISPVVGVLVCTPTNTFLGPLFPSTPGIPQHSNCWCSNKNKTPPL